MKSSLSPTELEARLGRILELATKARTDRDRSAQIEAFYEISLLADVKLSASERFHRTEGSRESRTAETAIRR